jgi:hypothetical protein
MTHSNGLFYRFFFLIALLLPTACSQPVSGPPSAGQIQSMISELLDVSRPDDQREAVDAQLMQNVGANSPQRLNALVQIVEGRGQHPEMKIYALDQIRQADVALVQEVLMENIPLFQDWDVLKHACQMAVELQDKDLITPLVSSLARPATSYTLGQRPEVWAIEQLSGRKLAAELIYLLLIGSDQSVRLDALQELYDLQGRLWLQQFILGAPQTDTLIGDLQWYARTFHYVPRNDSEVLWIQELHEPQMAVEIRAAQEHLTWIDPQELPNGVEPRLIYLLAFLDQQADYPPHDVLMQQVAALLGSRRHMRRTPAYPGAPDDIDPTLAANQNRLSYCDLLLIKVLAQALEQSANCRDIYALGYRSMSDPSSEEGGLLAFAPASSAQAPALLLQLYPSELKINRGIYVSGEQLMLATPRGAAQFIFHFQNVDNSQYVGPAAGDVVYVKNTCCNVVVFTSVGDHVFDAMLDLPSGAVIDLGVFTAPD